MPSSMIHLFTAYKYNPNASVAFWIGNIIPDTISGRKEKDKSHFRDRTDRFHALCELASTLDLTDEYSLGILLHLYLDYCWDLDPLHKFIESYKDDNWFLPYRQEISLAGAWLCHHTQWGKTVWEQIKSEDTSAYKDVHGIIKEEMMEFISRNSKWHIENNIGPSSVFTPQFVEEFTSKAAIDFKKWLQDIYAGRKL